MKDKILNLSLVDNSPNILVLEHNSISCLMSNKIICYSNKNVEKSVRHLMHITNNSMMLY